jgi:hypothetical protein
VLHSKTIEIPLMWDQNTETKSNLSHLIFIMRLLAKGRRKPNKNIQNLMGTQHTISYNFEEYISVLRVILLYFWINFWENYRLYLGKSFVFNSTDWLIIIIHKGGKIFIFQKQTILTNFKSAISVRINLNLWLFFS